MKKRKSICLFVNFVFRGQKLFICNSRADFKNSGTLTGSFPENGTSPNIVDGSRLRDFFDRVSDDVIFRFGKLPNQIRIAESDDADRLFQSKHLFDEIRLIFRQRDRSFRAARLTNGARTIES
jgi:hypothetical protein